MKQMSYKTMLSEMGVSYLGGCLTNPKTTKSYNNGVLTYILYLAPYKMSGYNVCPNAKYCNELCLNGSGHNKSDILFRGANESTINICRIKKTKSFFEQKEIFMNALIHEIKRYKNVAKRLNLRFAIRLNGTSDISPLAFHHPNVCKDKNILEIFPNVQFYDYTKVFNRTLLPLKYNNYDITFSYDGHNWNDCEAYLNNGGRVAVVFENELPHLFKSYKVIDANNSDIRFDDSDMVICGLHYHRVAKNYRNGHYIGVGNTDFVVKKTDSDCLFTF